MKKHSLIILALAFLSLPFARTARAASATIDIPEKYASVEAGDRLYFNLEVLYPENDRRRDLRINYVVKEGDEVIATDSILKAIETQASFTDYIQIPADAKPGLHTVEADIESYDGSLSKQVSASFQVAAPDNLLGIYFWILLAAVLGVGAVLFLEVRHFHSGDK